MARRPHKYEDLTTDLVWKLIEPKIAEYWQITKVVFWILVTVIGTITALFFGVAATVVASPTFRATMLKSMVKVEQLFADQNSKDFLHEQIDSYLRSEKPASIFSTPNWPLRAKVLSVIDGQFKQAISSVVVASSFSTEFVLSDKGLQHALRFLKADGNTAEIDCYAVYSGGKDAKKTVHIKLNNFKDLGSIAPVLEDPGSLGDKEANYGKGRVSIGDSNAKLFNFEKEISDTQTVTFLIDADQSFDGSISVDCTISVIGHVKLVPQLAGVK